MSSRVGTAIPASRSTALSSAAVGFTRRIQSAGSGSAARSAATTFFSEVSEGTNTANMGNSRTEQTPTQKDLARFWQALQDGRIGCRPMFVAAGWRQRGPHPAVPVRLPKNQPEGQNFAAEKTQEPSRSAKRKSKVWNCGQLQR